MDWKLGAFLFLPVAVGAIGQALCTMAWPHEEEAADKEPDRKAKRTKGFEQMADSHAVRASAPAAPQGPVEGTALAANVAAVTLAERERLRRRLAEEADRDRDDTVELGLGGIPPGFDFAEARLDT